MKLREIVLGQAVPVGVAVGAYGLSYGVLAVAAGLPPWMAVLSSVLVLAGGSQFAFIGVLAASGAPITGAISGLLLNVRLVAFGLAIAPHLKGASLPRRLLDAYLVVDEPVAMGLNAKEGSQARSFRIVGLSVVITWIGATTMGAFGGQLIGDPEVFGLDAAFPAGFLALAAPWLRKRRGRVAAIVGAGLALALTPIAPPGIPIIAAGLGAVVALRVTADDDDTEAADMTTDPSFDTGTNTSCPQTNQTTEGDTP